ncbi:MAG TPA: glycosyltransferase family 2 protein [Solirubrobacteraceae bacterium]
MDLAIIVVSANDARWLPACLSSVYARVGGAPSDGEGGVAGEGEGGVAGEHAGDIDVEVFVVANGCTDATRELVRREFPRARLIDAPNHGFAAGNNRALECAEARYVLLLNPDTEILDGTFAQLVGALDARPHVGVAGVRQVGADGALHPTIRRFPNALRALGEALACERWPWRPAWAGERVLDAAAYTREQDCDWTIGSFLLIRREALLGAGLLDERFFLYCEEPDLCLRVRRAGWRVRHLPQMTIRHHAGKGGVRPRLLAQEAYARRQYAHKHFSRSHRALYVGALGLRYALRAPRRGGQARALLALGFGPTRGREPPFMAPPPAAVPAQAAAACPRCSSERSI